MRRNATPRLLPERFLLAFSFKVFGFLAGTATSAHAKRHQNSIDDGKENVIQPPQRPKTGARPRTKFRSEKRSLFSHVIDLVSGHPGTNIGSTDSPKVCLKHLFLLLYCF